MSIQATIHKLKDNLSKRTSMYAAVVLMLLSVLLPITSTLAEQVNLIANPSIEMADSTGAAATSWTKGGWGTNTATYTWQNTGKDGNRSHGVNVSKYTNGDAKWMSAPITVKPNTEYKLSDWYVSNAQTSLELSYTSTTGAVTYIWLANVAASTTWKQATATFKTPADVKQVSIYHVIGKVGSLQTDAYSLTDLSDPGTTPTPVPPTVSISAPANGATVSGTQTITAAATDTTGVSGVQFKIDGNNFGTEDIAAPYTTTLDTKTLSNAGHTISAIARNSGGLTSTATINVTVNNITTPPPNPNPNPTNLIANPGVETASGTTPANWWNNSWGSLKATFNYPTTGAHSGSRSLKTTVSNYQNGDAKWSFANVNVAPGKTYKYTSWYKSTVDSEIDAAVTMNDGSIQYYYLTTVSKSSTWKQISTEFTAPVNAKQITVYHALATNGNVTTDDFSLTEYTPQGFGKAMVTLTFDDGWRSQYDHAMPILDKYDMDATFYLLTETINYPDYMTVAQMQALKDRGNEIDSHTVSHANLPTLTLSELTKELTQSQNQLRSWYGNSVADDFASPYGAYNATTVNEIKKYYRSHRSTDEGFNSKDSFDIYNIKVQNVLFSTPASQVDAWIKQAQREHTWLVLVYHEVATALEDPTYSISPEDLDAQLAALKASGVTVTTVGQALDYIKLQN